MPDYKPIIGDVVMLKKPHACKENKWEVEKVGVDIKLKCLGCNHEIILPRYDFNKRFKKKVDDKIA